MKSYISIVLTLLLLGCATSEPINVQEPDENSKEEPPISKRIYYLQHKLISSWVFETEGAFFLDMQNGEAGQLIEAASEIVTPEYAKEIVITHIAGRDAVSFKFPEPNALANCYYSIAKKNGDAFSYYTYEKTMDFGDEKYVGVIGSWNSDGVHSIYGPRSYKSEEEFIQDILELK